MECLEEDLQAEQEQGTQALSGVARHQPVHLQLVGERFSPHDVIVSIAAADDLTDSEIGRASCRERVLMPV